ncbi:ABC transporter substrate-binding protein [Pseudoalteromonas denitrificans]|uniref:Glycine betaine/proline transport system substrate-binding protein n=1 Tax=Pseudoalteromonas denitrificans DSM 6059 TaxID=1123010 RepID=A0A1I1N557_9GAMM|nr:ABC transporter substrate-binding protein [Pseudoalteromonas denitrificans]SFC92749.1 glycine betaine/proline transport system substrate-binding protein [Pseudoalteromonas denitrificans DSM 6059]
MKKSFLILMLLANSNLCLSTSVINTDVPIKIILNNWSSQLVVSHIVGTLFKKSGFTVEYVYYPTDGQWYILKHNIAHVQVEVWEGTMADKYQQLISKNKLINAGDYKVITREDWWYPKYVEKLCPGLPDWRALKKCTGIFSRKEQLTKGIYFGGPWEKPDKARVRALGLNFKVINTNTADQLWFELEKAYKHKKPIILFNWTPNWVGSVYQGQFVDFPEHHIECETQPSWGINPNYLYDCGNPRAGWLKKVSSTDLPKKWPCAFKILNNMNFNNSELESIAALVDVKKMSPKKAADHWINNNQTKWHSWLCDLKSNP